MKSIKKAKLYADIEAQIVGILRPGPMRQCEIADRLPMELYVEVGHVIRDMAARGIITREKSGASYMVRLGEGEIGNGIVE